MRQRVPFGLITACCLLCPTVSLGAAESAKTIVREDVKNIVKDITAVQPAGAVTGLELVGVVKEAASGSTDVASGTMDAPKANVTAKDAERISVDFYKVDLHNVFRLLGQVSHKNIVVDEHVNGTLTLALQDVPWPFILEVIKNLKDLDSVERENTILIYPRDKKVDWAKEESGGKGGELEMVDKTLELSSKKGAPLKEAELVIDTQDVIQSPLENIMNAQEVMAKGLASEKRGDLRQAIELYVQASELWPENTSLSKKIAALALGRGGDEIMALNYAKKALRIMPRDGEAATMAAVALARMGKAEDARIYFERAMNAEDVSLQTLYNYAVFLFSSGSYKDAMRVTNRIESNFTLSPEVMLLKAMCLEALNNPEQAAGEYRAILNSGKSVPAEILRAAEQRLQGLQAMGRNR